MDLALTDPELMTNSLYSNTTTSAADLSNTHLINFDPVSEYVGYSPSWYVLHSHNIISFMEVLNWMHQIHHHDVQHKCPHKQFSAFSTSQLLMPMSVHIEDISLSAQSWPCRASLAEALLNALLEWKPFIEVDTCRWRDKPTRCTLVQDLQNEHKHLGHKICTMFTEKHDSDISSTHNIRPCQLDQMAYLQDRCRKEHS